MQAGVFQCASGGRTPTDKLEALATALRHDPLDLIVCPELFLSGYDVGAELARLAEPPTGAFAQRIAELARSSCTTIVYGYPERDGAELYNAAACIGMDGTLIANHRKTLLPPGFESTCFQCGERMTAFDLDGLRCGILICYEAEFPEAVRAAADAGVQVLLVPTALGDTWESVAYRMMPTRAFENGIWLLYANHAGTENRSCYLGASCIVAPDGQDAARAGVHEQLILADIDSDRVVTAQARLPYLRDVIRLRRNLNSQA